MAKVHWTPEGWRCEKLREHLYRARWMDYQSPSIQMLTLVTVDRRPILGELRGEHIALTPLGEKVAAEIERIPTYLGAQSIEIYDYVVMPDHVHILLRIHDRLPRHLGQYIRWFKVQCSDAFTAMVEAAREVLTRGDSREYSTANNGKREEPTRGDSREHSTNTNNREASTTAQAPSTTNNREACTTAQAPSTTNNREACTTAQAPSTTNNREASTTTQAPSTTNNREASTTTQAPSTTNNREASTTAQAPSTTNNREAAEEARRVLAGVSASMMSPKSKNLLLFAHEYHDSLLYGKGQLAHMWQYIKDNPRRLALKRANRELFRIRQDYTIGGFSCTVLGNIFLAGHPQCEVLQCTRRLTTEQIAARCEACLMAAANGTVYITAAISEGEKVIARTLREHGFPLIILLEKGFPEPDSRHYRYYKPQGVYFEACAAGRLLLVEPHAEALEHPDIVQRVVAKTGNIPHTTQRYRFVAMNKIAEAMCGETDYLGR